MTIFWSHVAMRMFVQSLTSYVHIKRFNWMKDINLINGQLLSTWAQFFKLLIYITQKLAQVKIIIHLLGFFLQIRLLQISCTKPCHILNLSRQSIKSVKKRKAIFKNIQTHSFFSILKTLSKYASYPCYGCSCSCSLPRRCLYYLVLILCIIFRFTMVEFTI